LGSGTYTREKADGLGAPPWSSGGFIRSEHGNDPAHAVSEVEKERREASTAPVAQQVWRNGFGGTSM